MTRPRLLLVDDEPVNIRVLREIFREECDLLMATSGQQAIEVCTGERPDLVLLDIMMLGMDGLETCRRLLQEPMFESLPIIFVTGQTSAEGIVGGAPYGAGTIAGADGARTPSETDLAGARFQGAHVARIATLLSGAALAEEAA